MSEVSMKDAKADLSRFVATAAKGEFVTITRHGKPVAVLVSVEAAEAAGNALRKDRPSLIEYLKSFPAEIDLNNNAFMRNPAASREPDR